MDHFAGITPRERYDNELLIEIKKMNENMDILLVRNAQAVEPIKTVKPITHVKPVQRRRKKVQ